MPRGTESTPAIDLQKLFLDDLKFREQSGGEKNGQDLSAQVKRFILCMEITGSHVAVKTSRTVLAPIQRSPVHFGGISMTKLSRRTMLKTAISGATMASIPSMSWQEQKAPIQRKGHIKQSVSRWCYKGIALDDLCAYGAQIGLKGVDLLNPDEYEIPARHGLVCSMGYADGGDIGKAMNRVENHAKNRRRFSQIYPAGCQGGRAQRDHFLRKPRRHVRRRRRQKHHYWAQPREEDWRRLRRHDLHRASQQ